jgi:outer membrane receptor protein involved in Fe transport
MPIPSRWLWLLVAAALARALSAQDAETADIIDVVGTTPLGAAVDADRVPANVQVATAEELRASGALDLADFLRRDFGSVFINEAQSNPLQPDVQYRGFVGSPLLGLPQGLAVYQDGVRINEPFGDTVNWALIPDSAIASIALVPGANPLFGQNALGGALAIRTKDGATHPGTRAEVLGGSFGRTSLQAETGGRTSDTLDYFVTAARLEEDGWRDFSLTDATQVFGKLALHGARSRFDLSLALADTELVGNGAAPIDLLEQDAGAIFTHPDRTENRLGLLGLSGERNLSPRLSLTGNAYVRSSDADTLNGDDSDFDECATTPAFLGLLCSIEDGAEELALDAAGDAIPADEALEGATVNRTTTRQDGAGLGLQATLLGSLGSRDNRLTVGLSHDAAEIAYAASTELGALDATRGAIPGGVFLGDAFTSLDATIATTGLFLTDVLSLNETTTLTLSGRFNRTDVALEDRLGVALNGDHRFERFNPAVGLTMALDDSLTFYASYSEASRAPSPVELTCADEDDPCRLPNAFLADPPLEQVVAHTLEAGLRGARERWRWHAGVFSTTNEDDILFISAGALTNQGFFDNVGETRREGIELDASGTLGERLGWSVAFTRLDATFRESFAVASPNNPAATDGEVAVEPGDRLPLVPERLLKAELAFAASDALSFAANVVAASSQHFRGDEGNLVESIDGYALLNLRAEYRFGARASLFVNVDNVLDEQYATFGVFGAADEVLGDDFDDPRFLGPGAPRAAWIGVRLEF